MRLRLPACRDPSVPAHRGGSRRRAGRHRNQTRRRSDESLSVQDSGIAARLYGLRQLRERLPGPDQGSADEAARKPARQGRGRALGIHAQPGRLQGYRGRQNENRQEQPVLPAAVRVLRSVRRLRRNAIHQGDHAALRRPHGDRQRDGLLVDLRRIGSLVALLRQRERLRAGMGQLAVRGQRRVRLGHSRRHRETARTTDRADEGSHRRQYRMFRRAERRNAGMARQDERRRGDQGGSIPPDPDDGSLRVATSASRSSQ